MGKEWGSTGRGKERNGCVVCCWVATPCAPQITPSTSKSLPWEPSCPLCPASAPPPPEHCPAATTSPRVAEVPVKGGGGPLPAGSWVFCRPCHPSIQPPLGLATEVEPGGKGQGATRQLQAGWGLDLSAWEGRRLQGAWEQAGMGTSFFCCHHCCSWGDWGGRVAIRGCRGQMEDGEADFRVEGRSRGWWGAVGWSSPTPTPQPIL